MNKNLDLAEILKDCPRGTKLYSPICGEVSLDSVDEDDMYYPIKANRDGLQLTFTRNGKYHRKFNGECMLFPSKDQRDWSKFKTPAEKFDPKTLKPFDKVIVYNDNDTWQVEFFSHICQYEPNGWCQCSCDSYYYCIPYNEDTKHLVGTTEEAPVYYRYWED